MVLISFGLRLGDLGISGISVLVIVLGCVVCGLGWFCLLRGFCGY